MTRADALNRLDDFVPRMPHYTAERNRVVTGHAHVSQLSPAIRHRMITENEVAQAALNHHTFESVEKFVQEVYWRLYWKSWLEMRPQVWRDFRTELADLGSGALRAAEKSLSGRSGIAIFDHFASELTETGYLHNHARMWFAAIWIHELKLPWQLGADFFHQHLLDGDPASNTLSWRWVAGLHTPGKNYLARASNLEKWIDADILDANREGLDRLQKPTAAFPPTNESQPDPVQPSERSATEVGGDPETTGLWIHEDDLMPDEGGAPDHALALVIGSTEIHDAFHYSQRRRDFIDGAMRDTASRGAGEIDSTETDDTGEALIDWARSHGLSSLVAAEPWVGPHADALPGIREQLGKAGLELHVFRKQSDQIWIPLATAGFFGFWKKLQKKHPLLKAG